MNNDAAHIQGQGNFLKIILLFMFSLFFLFFTLCESGIDTKS